ncbi:5-hydroxytryptamine receptor 3A [Brachyistius frenatus]|uniref:5-hydroxytryptamine receptor 3A n=1 Tax=Brachyistius frenatus TaxID=100188 RepID=UPI0037E74B42
MQSEVLKRPTSRVEKALLLMSLLTIGRGLAESNCTSRRCLAEMLINKGYLSQPQNENCTQPIQVPFIAYQTLSVDTKNLRLISRLEATILWKDPALQWDTSVYKFDQVVLPVNKVWTPELHVTNGILTTMQHSSRDLLASSNGTVKHKVIIHAEINCEINLFNYPFAADECPVAIHTWSNNGCGTQLELGEVKLVGASQGDWETNKVGFEKKGDDRDYITVELSLKATNHFITLVLPSILIIAADIVSFALPLGGGERNCFKVTLVLSFTMFLSILNAQLPGDSECSPIIRIHFCVCLILLVLSMLVSMLLTRVAQDGCLISRRCSKGSAPKNTGNKERGDEEIKADISVIQLTVPEDTQMLRRVVKFLEDFAAKEMETEHNRKFANTLDKIFFWFYFICGTVYVCVMNTMMVKQKCIVNHFEFWD